jgi:hypothetical protein
MTFKQLIITVTFLSVFAMALRVSVDTDTWWQLRTGELIAGQHVIPKTDSFSYTRAGESWVYPSAAWLSQLKLFLIYDSFGAGGLNLLVGAAVTLAFVFVYLSLSGGLFVKAFTLVLAAAASSVYWAARPYMASFILTAVFLWILEDFRWRRNNRLIWLPFLMILWANSHPGFAVGFILVAIYGLDESVSWVGRHWKAGSLKLMWRDFAKALRSRLGALILTGFGMVVAVFLNPSGPALLLYPFQTVSIGVLRDFIQEWQSPDFHQANVVPFIVLLFATIGALAFSKQRMALSDALLIGVFGTMALLAGRNIALFALAAPIVLSRHASPIADELRKQLGLRQKKGKPKRWLPWLNVAIVVMMLLGIGVKAQQVVSQEFNDRAFSKGLPIGAIDFIQREQPAGHMFYSYNWGGYLIWELPDYPVYTDGRTDLYSDELLTEWLDIVAAEPGWQQKLEAWDVHLILLEPHWALSKVLVYEDWRLLYEDEVSVLYGK